MVRERLKPSLSGEADVRRSNDGTVTGSECACRSGSRDWVSAGWLANKSLALPEGLRSLPGAKNDLILDVLCAGVESGSGVVAPLPPLDKELKSDTARSRVDCLLDSFVDGASFAGAVTGNAASNAASDSLGLQPDVLGARERVLAFSSFKERMLSRFELFGLSPSKTLAMNRPLLVRPRLRPRGFADVELARDAFPPVFMEPLGRSESIPAPGRADVEGKRTLSGQVSFCSSSSSASLARRQSYPYPESKLISRDSCSEEAEAEVL